jgi:hypothetical protein
MLEPAEKYFGPASSHQSAIYSWNDVTVIKNGCGLRDGDPEFAPTQTVRPELTASDIVEAALHKHQKRAPSTCKIALVADSWNYQDGHGSSKFMTVKTMCDTIAGIESIYRNQINTGFQIVSTLVYTNPTTDPLRYGAQVRVCTKRRPFTRSALSLSLSLSFLD